MRMLVDMMLTLPDIEGWYDRLIIVGTPDDCSVYAGSFRLGSAALTPEMLALAVTQAARSLHPLDVFGRREAQRRIR